MKAFRIAVILTFVAVQAAVSQTPTPTQAGPNPLDTGFRKILAEIGEARDLILSNYFNSKVDQAKLTASSMNRTLTSLDPHSSFLDAREAGEFRSQMNAQYFGIGAAIREVRDGSGEIIGTFVREAFRGGPAERAGLRFGDQIVDLDGAPMNGKGATEVRNHLLGARGTKIVVTVDRDGTRIRNEITRDAIPTPAVPDAYMIRPGIGYVAMTNSVSRTLHSEFVAALTKLRAAGMRSLILDIRNNGGGFAAQACNVVGEFVPRERQIFGIKGRATNASSGCGSAKAAVDVETPIVLLVNKATVSAAEFIASGFQDTDRAYLVGENTFGKGMLQSGYELDGGVRMHLTTSRFIGASGRMPQRDYSDGSLYSYYRNEGSGPGANPGPVFKTRAGRDLYSGHGITPDEVVAPPVVSERTAKFRGDLADPIFAFVRLLIAGRIKGLETGRLDRGAAFDHELKGDELPVTPKLLNAFSNYAVNTYRLDPGMLAVDAEYVEQRLRTEMIVAAFASATAQRFINSTDPQLLRAIAAIPKASSLLDRFNRTSK